MRFDAQGIGGGVTFLKIITVHVVWTSELDWEMDERG